MKKGKIVLYLLILIACVGLLYGKYYKSHICRATLTGDDNLCFDGQCYEWASQDELKDYTESDTLICKTTDGNYSIYEIEEYPDHEYVVVRAAWSAEVFKKRL